MIHVALDTHDAPKSFYGLFRRQLSCRKVRTFLIVNSVPTRSHPNKFVFRRVIFELFSDVVPKTSEKWVRHAANASPLFFFFVLFLLRLTSAITSFRALCTGEKGLSPLSDRPLYYKNSIIHRSISNFMIQGGGTLNLC